VVAVRIDQLEIVFDEILWKTKIPIHLISETAKGKSTFVKNYAKKRELGFVHLIGSHTPEASDLVGIPYREETGETDEYGHQIHIQKWTVMDWFPLDQESKGIIFIDELTTMPSDVQPVLFEFILSGRLHSKQLPKGWRIVAASNPPTADYIGANPMSEAMKTRFLHLQVETPAEVWVAYERERNKLLHYTKDHTILDFVEVHGDEVLSEYQEEYDLGIKANNRGMEMIHDINNLCELPEEVEFEVYAGLIGKQKAQRYISFRKEQYKKPPTADEILFSFERAERKIEQILKKNKFDMIYVINESFIHWFQQMVNRKRYNRNASHNFFKYIGMIPRDKAVGLLQELYKYDEIAEVITKQDKNDDILQYLSAIHDLVEKIH